MNGSERAAHIETFYAAATNLIEAGIKCCRNVRTCSMKNEGIERSLKYVCVGDEK
jgi:hypothetical protein